MAPRRPRTRRPGSRGGVSRGRRQPPGLGGPLRRAAAGGRGEAGPRAGDHGRRGLAEDTGHPGHLAGAGRHGGQTCELCLKMSDDKECNKPVYLKCHLMTL